MNQLRQKGFTMIELIMVIVILGVLSAFALPKFADLGGTARTAAVEGVAGSMRSAIGITRASVLANGISTTDNGSGALTVNLDGAPVELVFGYPAATDFTTATNLESKGIILAAGLVDEAFTDATSATNGDFTISVNAPGVVDVTLQTDCYARYTDAADASTAPVVTVVVTGC